MGHQSLPPAASGTQEHAAAPPPESRQLSLAQVDGEHRWLLDRAISRILSTEIAEETYAQILDGLPTSSVAYDRRSPPHRNHPIAHAHRELCPGMLEKARKFRDDFCPDILMFGFKVRCCLERPPAPD